MVKTGKTLNALSRIFCNVTKELLEAVTRKEVSFAKTIQKIPLIHLRPDIGCFVLFSGDYSGLMIMNFSAEAAMSIYRNQMINMGLPKEELAVEYTADEVVDSIGELMNQIIGSVRRQIEVQYDLVSSNTQPKAIALTTSIVLSIDTPEFEKDYCRKLSFKIDGHPFHIELSMEKTEFVSMNGEDVHAQKTGSNLISEGRLDFDAAKQAANGIRPKPAQGGQNIDFDALLKANK